MRILKSTLFIALSLLISCERDAGIESLELPVLGGGIEKVLDHDASATVFVFMAPDCPLCINYSLVVRQLEREFQGSDVDISLVFPGTGYSQDTIVAFLDQHELAETVYLDPDHSLVHLLEAKVTPEAVLVDNTGRTRYRGAIDDWVYGTGLRKQQVSKRYLRDAIISVLKGDDPDTSYVRAYGCYIELI